MLKILYLHGYLTITTQRFANVWDGSTCSSFWLATAASSFVPAFFMWYSWQLCPVCTALQFMQLDFLHKSQSKDWVSSSKIHQFGQSVVWQWKEFGAWPSAMVRLLARYVRNPGSSTAWRQRWKPPFGIPFTTYFTISRGDLRTNLQWYHCIVDIQFVSSMTSGLLNAPR